MTTSAKRSPPARRSRSRRSSTGGSSSRDRLPGDSRLVLRRAVHEHIDVPGCETHSRHDDERGHEERGDRVAGREAERRGDQAGEDGERPSEVASEVERVREQRVTVVAAGPAQRYDGSRSVDREHERNRGERPPGRLDLELDDTRQAQDRRDGDPDADEDQKPRLGERGEVLRLRMAVRVATIGRADRDGDGEEREQRSGEVRARVRRLREQAEARAREARDELDRDEEAGGPDRDERRSALRRHGGRLRRQPTAA